MENSSSKKVRTNILIVQNFHHANSFKINIFIKVNGKMDKDKVRENNSGKMAVIILDIGKEIRQMDMAD